MLLNSLFFRLTSCTNKKYVIKVLEVQFSLPMDFCTGSYLLLLLSSERQYFAFQCLLSSYNVILFVVFLWFTTWLVLFDFVVYSKFYFIPRDILQNWNLLLQSDYLMLLRYSMCPDMFDKVFVYCLLLLAAPLNFLAQACMKKSMRMKL